MSLVFDTDIISTFGKIKRLGLLKDLFPNTRFFIPPSVYNELKALIYEIERRDREVIKDKDVILTNGDN